MRAVRANINHPLGHNDNIQDSENDGSPERPFHSSSSANRVIPRELHVPADPHPIQTPRVAVPDLNFHQTQHHGLYCFNVYISRLLVHIYDAGKILCISVAYFLQSYQFTNRLAKFAVSVVFLTSAVWYLIPVLSTFSVYSFAGALFLARPEYNILCQQFGNCSCWFEGPSFGNRLAQVSEKMANVEDLAALETIRSYLINSQEEIAKLSLYMKRSVKDPSAEVISRLSDYAVDSILARTYIEAFARMLDVTNVRLYSTTKSTIEGLWDISKVQRYQAYPIWVGSCILDNLFGGGPSWIDAPRCSTNLCASLMVKHIDWATPGIQGREEDASRLVKSFGKLLGHVNDAIEIQWQTRFEKMMEFYHAYQTNQTQDIDPHIWTRLIVFLENKIWTRIKALFVGKEPMTTALETLAPEHQFLPLILPFLEESEEYFSKILSNLTEMESELNQLRQKAEEQKSWTAIWCVFKRPPIRSWTKPLMSYLRYYAIPPEIPKVREGRRKIGMSPHVEDWE